MGKLRAWKWLDVGKDINLVVSSLLLMSQPSVLWAQSVIEGRESEVIEALFFGTGPLGAGACTDRHRWAGFPRGSHIKVIVSTSVSEDKRKHLREALVHVSEATLGAITVTFHLSDDPDPLPRSSQVISMTHPDPTLFGCVSGVGCTLHKWSKPGILKSSRAVQPETQPPQAYAHDVIGHGILGLCHIQGVGIDGPEHSLMSGGIGVYSGQISGTLTTLDIAALQAVYSSDLSPGATGKAFERAGLIDP